MTQAVQESTSICAEAVIPHLQRVLDAELAADASGDPGDVQDRLADLRDDISARLAGLKAETVDGAAVQVCVALHYAELTRGCTQQDDRDAFHTMAEGLLKSALAVIGKGVSENLWTCFVGGERGVVQ